MYKNPVVYYFIYIYSASIPPSVNKIIHFHSMYILQTCTDYTYLHVSDCIHMVVSNKHDFRNLFLLNSIGRRAPETNALNALSLCLYAYPNAFNVVSRINECIHFNILFFFSFFLVHFLFLLSI